MAINHNVDIVAHRLSHRGDACLGRLDGLESLDRHGRWNCHRLKSGEPFSDCLSGKFAKLFCVIDGRLIKVIHFYATQMAVEADVVTDRAAPKFVAGHAMNLSEDVP